MKINSKDLVPKIILPSIDGAIFDSSILAGKPFMISFFRFASCPFCNLRVHELVSRFDEFSEDFTIVAIFDSPIDNLRRHAEGHNAPFFILADEKNEFYERFGIQKSIFGVLKGMVTRMPRLLSAMTKGYIPTTFKGSFTTMPADFLVDRSGVVQFSYYGKDEGDHLSFEEIKRFSLEQLHA